MRSLTPEQLLYGYSRGIFPMAEAGTIFWYDPDPRAILLLDRFHVPRRLARSVRQQPFALRIDTAFDAVIRACAAPAPDREETWIDDQIIAAYTQLHELGFAHSVEAWQDGTLVGGLYGVAINSFFAGESMFSRVADASKVALVHLVQQLQAHDFLLLDVQFMTNHLRRFGAIEIPRAAYQRRLAQALARPNSF
jgi:leucyl/phenylalanyl-tRNA---protein transferase